MSLTIRSIEHADVEICGKIGFQAHKAVSSAHGYPSEQPSIDFAVEMIKTLLANPYSQGYVAERWGKILGSIFVHKFPPSPVAAIGPLTVDPSGEGGGVGRALMEASLMEARKRDYDQVRLIQGRSPSPSTLQKKYDIRAAELRDISACNQICVSIHGFSRELELQHAIDQRVASVAIDSTDGISGYAAGIGFFGHAVAKTNEILKALIANSSSILGPGFFVPGRNSDLIRWLLDAGFRIVWPANLMTVGNYVEPLGPFLPSIAY